MLPPAASLGYGEEEGILERRESGRGRVTAPYLPTFMKRICLLAEGRSGQ